MPSESIITDPLLLSCLQTANTTLTQTLSIIDLLSTQAQATSPTTTSLQHQISRSQKLLTAHLSRLRTLTRRAAYAARTTKTLTTDSRRTVDALLLQLQNLFYEQRHLLSEIAACEGYDHAYMHLPLVNVEEYLEVFPGDKGLEEEELMLKRIEWERRERERMEGERRGLVERKEELVRDNQRRREEMKRMDERLEGVVDGLRGLEGDMEKDL